MMRNWYHLITAGIAGLAMVGCGLSTTTPQGQLAAILGGTPPPAEAEGYRAFLVARYASLTNDPARARDGYEAAFLAAPDNDGLAERAVYAALLAGDVDNAVRLAGLVSRIDEDTSSLVRLTLAMEAVDRGRLQRAERLLVEGEFGPFDAVMATYLRAWITLETQDVGAAVAVLDERPQIRASLPDLTATMAGLLYLSAGADVAALEQFQRVSANGPRLAMATEAEARLLIAQGDVADARRRLDAFRQSVGPNPALESLARQLEDGQRPRLERPTLDQGSALALYLPAAALASRSRGDYAGVYFVLAQALDEELDIAKTLWADGLDAAGRAQSAIEVLADIPPSSPFYATARGQMAWVYRRAGQNNRALEVATEALGARPDRDLQVQLGDLLTTLDRDGEAIDVFTTVTATDNYNGTPDWRIYLARGAALERLGRWPEAEADLREALRLSPDNPRILNHLGYSLVDRGRQLDEGLRMVTRAVDLEPSSGANIDSLGWAYYKLGAYDRAVLQLERAVALRPGDPVINDHLGDAYWQVGRKTEARFQWQRASGLTENLQLLRSLSDKLDQGLPEPDSGAGHSDQDVSP